MSNRAERRRAQRENGKQPVLEPTDFWKDYLGILRRTLKEHGFENYEKFEENTFDIRYFDAMMRLVESRPRKVHEASTFKLPSSAAKHEKGLDALKEKIRRGDLLTPHLSKGVFDLTKRDGMLLDWRVHHLHLGERIDPKTKRIERTGPVLFARFEQDDAYLNGIEHHGAWAKPEVLETIIDHWPHLVTEAVGMKGPAPSDDPNITEKDRKEARAGGLMTFYTSKNGKIYVGGGGYSTAGTATLATDRADRMRDNLRYHEARVAREFPAWCHDMTERGRPLAGDPIRVVHRSLLALLRTFRALRGEHLETDVRRLPHGGHGAVRDTRMARVWWRGESCPRCQIPTALSFAGGAAALAAGAMAGPNTPRSPSYAVGARCA